MGKIIFDMPNRKLENAVKEKTRLSDKQKLFFEVLDNATKNNIKLFSKK
jgi:ribosomal protein L23|tara:strand:+ start:540 stop:686 length:147 start_codon:yes stop_codon:yes gene_type:complete